MTPIKNLLSLWFPYIGKKLLIAKKIWRLFGNVDIYIEPLCGSSSVFLGRPTRKNNAIEIINDNNGLVANFWRAMKYDAQGVAQLCDEPMSELDYHARWKYIKDRATPELVELLNSDPEFYDTKIAGYWGYCMNSSIMNHTSKLTTNAKNPPKMNSKPALGKRNLSSEDSTRIQQSSAAIQARIRKTRIACGDWKRVLTPNITQNSVGDKSVGIYFDPPYLNKEHLYNSKADISGDVRKWCIENYCERFKIIISGYEKEHDELLKYGWHKKLGKSVMSGMMSRRKNLERLWCSPNIK
jgi:site-specific DNA-adenine methylase